jgi:hypothetical protein
MGFMAASQNLSTPSSESDHKASLESNDTDLQILPDLQGVNRDTLTIIAKVNSC